MKTSLFRKNAMKTVNVRPSKGGLRITSRNSVRTNVARASINLKTHVGELMQAMNPYILGEQFTQEMKDNAFNALGEVGYDLAILGRVLKVNLPSSTKKSRLSGTRTAALLQLDGLTTQILNVASISLFEGPRTKKEMKEVRIPTTGAKEQREVEVVDAEAEAAVEAERQNAIRSILSSVVDLYWRITFDIFHEGPANILAAKFDRIRQANPNVTFDMGDKPKATKKKTEAVPA